MSSRQVAAAAVFAAACVLLAWQFFVAAGNALHLEARRATDSLSPKEVNAPAEDLAFVDASGRPVRLSDFRGRPVFLNFWATWCPPCVEEMPSVEAMARELGPEGLVVLAVSVDESWDDVNRFFAGRSTPLVLLLDKGGSAAATYGVVKFPETFLIQPDFQIRHHFIGPRVWSTDYALRYLRSYL